MSALATVSNALITAILDGLPLGEGEKRAMLGRAGLVEARVRDVNGRTSILAVARLWSDVLRATGDEFVGLHIGRAVPGERFGLAPHAAQHGRDFREALEHFARYAALINGLMQCRLDEAGGLARFTMKFHADVLGLERHAVDIAFAGVTSWARERLDAPFALREARLAHGLRHGRGAYEAALGAPVSFGCKRNELVFDAALLGAAIRRSDAELGAILRRYAEVEIASVSPPSDLPTRVAQIVRRELQAGRPLDLGAVCVELRTPPRNLQRRLKDSSTTFRALVDDARRSLAPALLGEPDATVEQVGYRLGFSEPTAFIRAFRKWYGVTPGGYRRSDGGQ